MAEADREPPASGARFGAAWAPLRHRTFRMIWFAQFGLYIGLWVQSVGAAWLMTSLSDSASLVSLVWAASTLPILLFSMIGGALADAMDRRNVIIVTQVVSCTIGLVLALFQELSLLTPALLLALTFLLDSASAIRQPAFQSSLSDLVPRQELPAAVALGSVNFNLARSVGPGIGGLIVAAAGSEAAFLFNVVTMLGAMVAMVLWRRTPLEREYSQQRLGRAMIEGVRYAVADPVIRAVLIRAGAFSTCATAGWSLMPLTAKYDLGGGAFTYGLMLGALGLGAVAGAAVIVPARARFGDRLVLLVATLAFTAVLVAMALLPALGPMLVVLFFGGTAWFSANATFNTTVQLRAPATFRARALSCYFMAIYGLMSFGAWGWGALADAAGLHATLLVAAAGLAATAALGLRRSR